MIKKTLFNIIFVMSLFILDSVVMHMFPVDYSSRTITFTSMFSFTILILMLRDEDIYEVIYLALFLGLLLDLTTLGGVLVNTLSILLAGLCVYVWSQRLSSTLIETVLLILVSVFIRMIMTYFILILEGYQMASLLKFIQNEVFLTVVVAVVFSFVSFLTLRIRNRILKRYNKRLRQSEESLHYY